MTIRATLLACFLPALACNTVDSSNVFTSGLYASISATADGDGDTVVRTTLYLERPSSLNYIELEGDDVLRAHAPTGESRVMSESSGLGTVRYSTRFELDDSDAEFIVELDRTIDDPAPDSRVTLPTAFDVLTADGSAYSRATDDIVVEWDVAADRDDFDFSVTGSCIEAFTGFISGDSTSMTIEAGEVVKREPDSEDDVIADSCQVTVSLERSRLGIVDDAYGYGGTAIGRQRRELVFTSEP